MPIPTFFSFAHLPHDDEPLDVVLVAGDKSQRVRSGRQMCDGDALDLFSCIPSSPARCARHDSAIARMELDRHRRGVLQPVGKRDDIVRGVETLMRESHAADG